MAEKVKDITGGMAEYQVTVNYKDENDKAQKKTGGNGKESGVFLAPGAWGNFKAYIAKLDDKAMEYAYDLHMYALDLKQRSQLRPTVAAESPIIMRDGLKINLATGEIHDKDGALKRTLTLTQRIRAVNSTFEDASTYGTEPSSRVVTARRMLLDSGAVVEKNGVLAAK